MFETIKSWFQGADAPQNENKWDANTVTMQQPNSPAAPSMNQTVTEQPVRFPSIILISSIGNWETNLDHRVASNPWEFTCGVVTVAIFAAECECWKFPEVST